MSRRSEADPAARRNEITELLHLAAAGDRAALESVSEWAYEELEKLARSRLRRRYGAGTPTLEPAALVNETFLRMLQEDTTFENRRHLLAFAGTVMLRTLIDYQRRRGAAKRGAGALRVTLSGLGAEQRTGIDLLDFRRALERLEELDERKAEVVGLRLLWGYEMAEIAEIVGVSLTTVERDWRFARTWLAEELELS